jgi:hypothetical protein
MVCHEAEVYTIQPTKRQGGEAFFSRAGGIFSAGPLDAFGNPGLQALHASFTRPPHFRRQRLHHRIRGHIFLWLFVFLVDLRLWSPEW